MFPSATAPPSVVFEQVRDNHAIDTKPDNRVRNASVPTFSGTGAFSWEHIGSAIVAPMPSWRLELNYSVVRLRALQPNWDGYGSVAIAVQALFQAETLVREALDGRSEASAPYLVPVGDGSVQIEWHKQSGEIELSIDPDGNAYIWGRSHVSGYEFEGEGEKALALFSRWAPRLASESCNAIDVPISKEAVEPIAA